MTKYSNEPLQQSFKSASEFEKKNYAILDTGLKLLVLTHIPNSFLPNFTSMCSTLKLVYALRSRKHIMRGKGTKNGSKSLMNLFMDQQFVNVQK